MLRLSDGKTFANIWDALVIPAPDNTGEYNNYILGEVKRADTFAKHARGKLIKLKHEFGITEEANSFDQEEK
jgi:hypothetical protein